MLASGVISELQGMKQAGRKIVGVVAWDFQIAQIADRAGVDLVSVGDSVGVHLWGQAPDEITIEEMLIVCRAVRRGVQRAIVSVDLPAHEQNIEAALRLKECGADMVKLIGSADLVRSVVRAGVPVFAEFHGGKDEAPMLVEHARRLEDAGATALDFRHSGPVAGEAVTRAVRIPVIGGLGGGPWLDGRMRIAHAAIGYAFANVEKALDQYANVARITFDALKEYSDDVRAARQIKGQRG
jgi:3-methyl-2-oxobutanoate hydroxymethyltransferase